MRHCRVWYGRARTRGATNVLANISIRLSRWSFVGNRIFTVIRNNHIYDIDDPSTGGRDQSGNV